MNRFIKNLLLIFVGVFGIAATGSLNLARAADDNDKNYQPTPTPTPTPQPISGRVVAIGIPGASVVSPVGTFHTPPRRGHGGDSVGTPNGVTGAANQAGTIANQPGQILDPSRIIVGSKSNFGVRKANRRQKQGSLLSIDPSGSDTLKVDRDFARDAAVKGGQASALNGRVQLYSSQTCAFRNRINNPNAATARFTAVSNPLGLSIDYTNSAGLLWPANAPLGLKGIGTSAFTDSTGLPAIGPDLL